MQESIKPCLYCGEQPKLPNLEDWPYMNPAMLCAGCKAQGPVAPYGEKAIMLWNYRLGETAPGIDEEGFRECPDCAGDCISSGDTGGVPNSEGVIVPLYFSNCCDCSALGPHTAARVEARKAWNKSVTELEEQIDAKVR